MRELGFIDDAHGAGGAAPSRSCARAHAPLFDVEAPYVAEMARLELRNALRRRGRERRLQGLHDHRRPPADRGEPRLAHRAHRIRPPARLARAARAQRASRRQTHAGSSSRQCWTNIRRVGVLVPAVVVSVGGEDRARVRQRRAGFAQIDWDGLSWARRQERGGAWGRARRTPRKSSRPATSSTSSRDGKGNAQLAQLPEAQSALVALDPNDGAIVALVGGFDYFTNKYNRVTQAQAPAGLRIQAVPVLRGARERLHARVACCSMRPSCSKATAWKPSWRPENSSGQFHGPTRLARSAGALAQSRFDPPAARDGHGAFDRLHHPLRLSSAKRCPTI